jgi:hypothetical protein
VLALAGALPALRAGRTSLADALNEGGRSEDAAGVRTRRLLVAGEVARRASTRRSRCAADQSSRAGHLDI